MPFDCVDKEDPEHRDHCSLATASTCSQYSRKDWNMSLIGSAAVGATAGAQGDAGGEDVRATSRARRQRATSVPKGKTERKRSRSPGEEVAEIRVEKAERAIPAPVYVEPGADGDTMGAQERHRDNMRKIFGYLNHVSKVTNEHADFLDEEEFEKRSLRRQQQKQASEIAHMKAIIEATTAEMKDSLGQNDMQLKEAMAASTKAVWDFLEANNHGIMQMFREADAAVSKLAGLVEELKTDESHKPSSVATGPRGLAFMGLRADLKKLEEKVDVQFKKYKDDVDELKVKVNLDATAAGAAPATEGGTSGNAMA